MTLRKFTNTAGRVLELSPNVSPVNVPVRLTFYGYMLQLPVWIGMKPHKGLAPTVSGVLYLTPLSMSAYGVHAFIISYYRVPLDAGRTFLFSGFIRIYDTKLNINELGEDVIKGIVNATFRAPLYYVHTLTQIQKRISHLEENLHSSFNTLKSELDNLSKILDKILKLIEKNRSQHT